MLNVICGYPASGKSTYCRKAISPGDMILDADSLYAVMTNSEPHEDRLPWGAGRMLNDMVHWVEYNYRRYGIGDLYLIRMAPTDAEMLRYNEYGNVRITVLDTPKDVCLARVQQRGDYDLAVFGKACGKVDGFREQYYGCYDLLSGDPPTLPTP